MSAGAFDLAGAGTLAVRVGDGPWHDVDLTPDLFADPAAATPEEIAAVLDGIGGLVATVEDGELVLASPRPGADATVEIDGTALGLRGAVRAAGSGPGPARLAGAATGPFTFPDGAGMTVRINGRGHRVRWAAGERSAGEVVADIDAAAKRGIAGATADGAIELFSTKLGPGSTVQVVPGDPDAAAVLGFVGDRALSDPWRAEPARLRVAPPEPGVTVINLSGSPVELHLPGGSVVVPARGRHVTTSAAAADPVVARLVARSVLHVEPGM